MILTRRHLSQRLLLLVLLLLGPIMLLHLAVQAMVPSASGAILQNNLVLSGHSGGGNQAIAIDDQRAVIANGSILSLLDVSDSNAPVRDGMLALEQRVTSLGLVGNTIYVGGAASGLALVDATTPTAMAPAQTLLAGETIYDIETAGTTLYVAHDSGLTAYNITDPANPIAVTTVSSAANWLRISLLGNQALATNGNNSVYVLDLTIPDQPVVQGSYVLGGTPGGAAGVGNTAYASWSDCSSGDCIARFSVLDISNPNQPSLVTERTVGSGIPLGMAAGGGYLYVTRIGSGSVHVGAALDVFDIATPALPAFAADYDVPGTYGAFDIILDSPIAYLAHGEAGFHILDVSDPTNPDANSLWAGPGRARNVVIHDGMAYIGANAPQDRAELWIQEYDSAMGPTTVSQFRIEQLRTVRDLAVAGDKVFVAGPNPLNTVGRIRLLDAADPENPVSLVSFDLAPIEHIAAADGYAYAHDENGLQIIDFREPMTVTQVASYGVGGETVLVNDLAFIAGGIDGLHILDVTTPSNPSLVGTVQGSWQADTIAVSDTVAYLGVGSEGVRVIDVSTPGSPVEVSQIDMGWQVEDLAIAGQYLVVGTAAAGVQILDVANPTSPTLVAYYHDDWTPSDIDIDGTTILATAAGQGVYRLSQRFDVAGQIQDLNGAGIADVTVTMSGLAPAVSEPDGSYGFSEVPAGSYTIQPTHPTFIFSPTTRLITVAPSADGQDFLMIPAPVSGIFGIGGGTLSFTDTQGLTTTVTIPAGAVSATVTVVMTPTVVVDQGNLSSLNHAFDLAVYAGGILQPDYQFLIPIGVAIYYSDADLGVAHEASLSLQQWQFAGWQDAGLSCTPPTSGIVDEPNNLFAQGLCESGRFALFGPVRQLFLPVINQP